MGYERSDGRVMRVSQLLGHATYTLTLATYGDWIEADDTAPAPLPAPPSFSAAAALSLDAYRSSDGLATLGLRL